ncbi:ATP-grasp domain-containing protein, partial [Vibrio parahaemolyticus]
HTSQLIRATNGLRFPVVVKANIGGSGAGIVKYNSEASLTEDILQNQIDFGIDHTALVQEYIPARGGYITRVETLGGKFLYAIKVYTSGES